MSASGNWLQSNFIEICFDWSLNIISFLANRLISYSRE